MDQDRWRKIKSIFDAAVEIDAPERLRFLAEKCEDDPGLQKEVQELVEAFEQSPDFIETTAAGEVASLILETPPTFKKGQRFAHYEIVRQIGVGGMGEVFLAHDENLERQVAVKILNEKFGRDESNVKRFVREAKAASSLNHPNILVIHEIALAGKSNYIVSEFVEGKTLRELMQGRQLRASEILDIAIQISKPALAAAHGANLVHRDIKPENVIVRPDGYVKVLDFGLAKLLGPRSTGFEASTVRHNETAKGVIMGTVNYMSPEQAKAEKVDERTDIFSLGVVIYELIAGRNPFQADSMSETFANLINTEPQPLSRFASNVPEELQRIVSKALQKNRDDRYQSVKDLHSDLKVLRENLEFDARLERSLITEQTEKTEVLHVTTGFANENTGETRRDPTRELMRKRPFAAIAFGVLIIALAGAGYYLYWGKQSSGAETKSLAVLPFINASQDPNMELLSDGITENIINNLSHLAALRVMSSSSAFLFKGDQTDTKSIASKLGVQTLVTGDIKQLGNKLIIGVRLIDASDNSQIWGNQYVKSSADILAVQNEIALAVAQNLRLKLTGDQQRQLAKRPTENVEAYELYLRGRSETFKLTPQEIYKGIDYFEQAIKIDPNYALAYAGISDAYRSLALGSEIDPAVTLPKSKAAADKAIEIDDTLSEGYTSLGATNFWLWDWDAAERNYRRALVLNPASVNAHLFYAHWLSNMGRNSEALAEIKAAREQEPLLPFLGALEGQFLLHAGRADEAVDRLHKTIELAPNFWMPHLFVSSAYIEKGMYRDAILEAQKASELSPAQTVSFAFEGYALSRSGKQSEARNLLEKLLKLSNERFVPPGHIAIIYNGLGETDKALEWLEKAYKDGDPKLAFLKVEPKWNNLRAEPRFIALMRQMKLE